MPKVTIEFNLPEETEEYKVTSKASDYYSQLWEIDNKCRNILKYGSDYGYKTIEDMAQEIRNMIDIYE